MKINIKYEQMPTSKSLSEIVTRKLEELHHKFNWILKAEVILKLDSNATLKNQICEIGLSAPGPRLFASSKASNFKKAIDSSIKKLEHQLKKRKYILANH